MAEKSGPRERSEKGLSFILPLANEGGARPPLSAVSEENRLLRPNEVLQITESASA